ncbi:hypothetical protein COU17_02915 [Candidatus Kaiserbacteria bacterium CG10_big_fil_rev_8_21_14_0_10_49_17]|uniref:Uncharacterized protein n=1 Tax=Candidatus Kaiserbacteria bacterium CG10_big_fil_rev_8_21_14_0_10_49_17 TaxID=1974609 RepID=A0A2M6WDW6_9BACT|nr:MAG: hypothetical protein COU17_02915 [Candidatus Kaiserbacteria bacterium CG10_big_fil_rev_8_21_14_0_10_49_17]
MCYHGFGHGVLAFLDYDFPDAVQFCSKVGTKEYHEREYIECAGGVVMEMVSGVHDPATWEEKKKKFLPDDDPLSLCRKGFIPEEVRPICYTYITPQLFLAVGGDLGNPTPEAFNKIFDLCSEIPTSDGENRLACFASLGKEFIAFVQERDIRNTEKLDYEQLSTIYTWCTLADEYDAIGACMISALNSIYWGGENNRAVSERFCSIVSDPKHKESCYSRLIENVDYYIDDITYRSAFCSELPPENQPLCKQRLLQ